MASTQVVSGVSNLNGVSMFHDEGVHNVEKYLPLLAKLFIDYKMNKSYAIGYLHRHFDIPATFIWLHEQVGDADRVLPKALASLDKSSIQPHSYALDGGEFKVAEWETVRPQPSQALSPEFLDALQQFATAHGLEDYLAIFPRTNKLMIESMLFSGDGQISHPDTGNPLPAGTTIEDTQWVFDPAPTSTSPLSGETTIKPQQRCTINVHGFHFVHTDSAAEALTTTSPFSGETTIKPQQRCTINVHGFHFVHTDNIDATTFTNPFSGETTIKPQQRCTINVHGFHFVHTDNPDATIDYISPQPATSGGSDKDGVIKSTTSLTCESIVKS